MTFRTFIRMVIGLPSRQHMLDGRPMPHLGKGQVPIAVVHDRRLSVGIVAVRRSKRQSPQYRIVAWRTYAGHDKKEHATMSLHRDELDPVMHLLEECLRRLPVGGPVERTRSARTWWK